MGFGRVANGTQLGSPLDFSAVVKLDPDESLARECVFAEVTAGDNRLPSNLVRVTLAGVAGDGERLVRVVTSAPIEEPVVTVNVTLGCTSRVTRQFVAFVDPPGLQLAPLASSASVVPPTEPPPTVEPNLARERRAAAVFVARREAASQASSGRVAAASDAVRRPQRPAVVRAATGGAGPRLQLDAPAAASPVAAAAAASAASVPDAAAPPVAAVAAAAASAAEAQAAALARERQRIQSLEDEMGRLRAESQAQRQALAGLQLQVGTTRSQRYANPLVYTLAALCLLLTTLVAGLLGRRSRDRAAARWLTSTMLARSAEPSRAPGAPAASSPAGVPSPEADRARFPEAVAIAAPARMNAGAVVAARPAALPVAPVGRASSVEELIDLEQQADFFVVLGQDDAAIELLDSHVDDDGIAGAVSMLKLLEIHRRVGDRAGYERVRAKVDARCNARTPAFDADPVRGGTLADHPDTVARLQALWAAPAQAREALHGLVFRGGGSIERFELPAFGELLFLHSIASDHVARSGADVDLLLRTAGPRATGGSTGPVRTVDLDLTVAPKRPAPGREPLPGQRLPVLTAAASRFDNFETLPSALRRPPDYENESTFVDLELEFPGLTPSPALPR